MPLFYVSSFFFYPQPPPLLRHFTAHKWDRSASDIFSDVGIHFSASAPHPWSLGRFPHPSALLWIETLRFWSLEETAVQQACELRTIPRVTLHVQHAVLYFRCVYICVASGAMLFYSMSNFLFCHLLLMCFPNCPFLCLAQQLN